MSEERYVYFHVTAIGPFDFNLSTDVGHLQADTDHRGVWQSRSGAKGQSRSPTSLRLSLGQEKKEFQSSIRGGAGRGQGTSKDRGITWQGQEAPQHADTNSTPLPEEDLPTDGYNSVAVEAAMKVPAEPPPSIYQPSEKPKSVGRSGSTPRASKRISCNPWR